MIETEQENKETTEDIEFDDDDEDSDEYDSDYVETNKRRDKNSIFDDEEKVMTLVRRIHLVKNQVTIK